MECNNKKCFTKKDALTKLNSLINSGEWSTKQKGRVYQCPDCNWYHLTSLMGEGKVDMRGVKLKLTDKWKKILKHQKTDGERVTYQQAKELKQKGYDKPCKYWYTIFHKTLMYSETKKNFNSFMVTKEATYHSSSYSAPTIEEYHEWKKLLKQQK